MHTVTKVLVVFVAILCVLLSALTMAYAVNADRIVSDYQNEVQRRATAEAMQKDISSAHQEAQARLQGQYDKAMRSVADKDGQVRALEAELARLQGEVQKAELARDSVMGTIDQQAATIKTQAIVNESYRNETAMLRQNELDWRKKELDIDNRLADLQQQKEVLEGNIRALQETVAENQRAMDELRQTGGQPKTATGSGAEPYSPTYAIRGRVVKTEIDRGSQDTMVQIDVGTASRVHPQMKLTVLRDGAWVGDIVVTRADLNYAIGKVVLTKDKSSSVRANDIVTSTLALR